MFYYYYLGSRGDVALRLAYAVVALTAVRESVRPVYYVGAF